MRLTIAILFAVCIAVGLPSVAWAQTDEAGELKRRADAAFDAKHYDEALALYDQSYTLSPQTAVLYNRGRALQYLARYPQALGELERFDKEASADLKAKVPGFDKLINDVRAHVALVQITSNVAGAHVLVGSVDFGVTPLPGPIRVNAGRQKVEALADGYYAYRRDNDFPGGQTTTVNVELASKDKHGLLTVRSTLEGTSIAVDGKGFGLAPTEAGLIEGSHAVVASKSGFSDATTRIVLRAGDQKDITLTPLKRPSIATRWWFWTIVGVVVVGAAAAVTVYALTTEGPAPTGNFSPGSVSF